MEEAGRQSVPDISGGKSGWSLGGMPTSVSPHTRQHGKLLCWLGPALESPRAGEKRPGGLEKG